MAKLSKEDRLDFVADITEHLLEGIENGVEIFVVLSFRYDKERDTIQCSNSSIHARPPPFDDRLEETVNKIVTEFMDARHPRWAQ